MFSRKNLLMLIARDTIISLIVIFACTVAILIFNNKIGKITDSVVENNKIENELKKKTELFSVIDKDSKIIGENDIKISNAYIPSNNVSEFMGALDSILPSTIPQIYQFETPVNTILSTDFPVSQISYTNSINIDIKNFSKYLTTFENLPYFTKINSLNISSQSPSGWVNPSSVLIKATLLTKTVQ